MLLKSPSFAAILMKPGPLTLEERRNPKIIGGSRKRRIAAGSGTRPEDINKLLKMHRTMADMMKAMSSGKRGALAGLGQMMGFGGAMPSPEELAAHDAGRPWFAKPATEFSRLARRRRKVSRFAGSSRGRQEEMKSS